MRDKLVYIGGYATEDDAGLQVYRLDGTSGALTRVQTLAGVANPSFFDISPDGRCLYAVNEVAEFHGSAGGGVSAFSLDPGTGTLHPLNHSSSVGKGPCHIQVERSGRYALVANYGSGSVTMLPISADGRLGEACDCVQHEGRSVDPQRQQGPHAHSINVDPTNTRAYAPDLGLDKVMCYRMDLEAGKLAPLQPAWVAVAAGVGPRHMTFHPSGAYAYLVTEMGNTVIVFAVDSGSGVLTEIQTVSALPAGYAATSYCADIHMSPDGRFLYASNRGHDSLAVFAVDAVTGCVKLIATPSSGGAFPRNFALDPSGTFLVSANQNSDNVVVYRRDPATGGLQPTGHEVAISKPVCVRIVAG